MFRNRVTLTKHNQCSGEQHEQAGVPHLAGVHMSPPARLCSASGNAGLRFSGHIHEHFVHAAALGHLQQQRRPALVIAQLLKHRLSSRL